MRLQRTIAEVTQKAGETPPRKLCGKFGHCYNPMRHYCSSLSCGWDIRLARSVLYLADETSTSTTSTANTKLALNVPVPLEMHQRHHGSLFAMAADPLQDKPMKSPLLLGSFSPGNCNDTDAEPITSTAGTSRWFTRNR